MHGILSHTHNLMRVLDYAQVKMLEGMKVAFKLCHMA